ncbi:MAG: leucine-rich repeat domain-containing protein [Gammaproteobacteria bacterium]
MLYSIQVVAVTALLAGCTRQFAITVNEKSVYDPRLPENARQVSDPDLQGCINLALRQSGVTDPANLTVLSCAAAQVEDLRGIAQLASLRFLDLTRNAITDLQPLASLPRLSGLSLADNAITDISPLLAINSLTAVVLSGNTQIPCSQLDRLEQRLGHNLTRPASCQD